MKKIKKLEVKEQTQPAEEKEEVKDDFQILESRTQKKDRKQQEREQKVYN